MSRKNSQTWNIADPIEAARLNHFNEDLDDLYAVGDDRLKIKSEGGLDISIFPGNWRVGSAEGYYNPTSDGDSPYTLTDNAVNYIMMTGAGEIFISNAWNANHARIAKVTTASGAITQIENWRPDLLGGVLGGGGFTSITSCVYDILGQLTSFIGNDINYTLTYSNSRLSTVSNGSTTWTINYDFVGHITEITQS